MSNTHADECAVLSLNLGLRNCALSIVGNAKNNLVVARNHALHRNADNIPNSQGANVNTPCKKDRKLDSLSRFMRNVPIYCPSGKSRVPSPPDEEIKNRDGRKYAMAGSAAPLR